MPLRWMLVLYCVVSWLFLRTVEFLHLKHSRSPTHVPSHSNKHIIAVPAKEVRWDTTVRRGRNTICEALELVEGAFTQLNCTQLGSFSQSPRARCLPGVSGLCGHVVGLHLLVATGRLWL